MNRFYSTLGRVRRVDSLSTPLILQLNLFLATHRCTIEQLSDRNRKFLLG